MMLVRTMPRQRMNGAERPQWGECGASFRTSTKRIPHQAADREKYLKCLHSAHVVGR